MTQWYDKNEFRNNKIPKMCLGPGTPPPPRHTQIFLGSWPLLLKKNSGYVHACTFHRKDNQSTNACVNMRGTFLYRPPPPQQLTFNYIYKGVL